MTDEPLRNALAAFDRALRPFADEMQRRALNAAVYGLINAVLNRVTLIVNQRHQPPPDDDDQGDGHTLG